MNACSQCGSFAINPGTHYRDPEKHLDLCDVCYWRKVAHMALGTAMDVRIQADEDCPQNARTSHFDEALEECKELESEYFDAASSGWKNN